jgi:N-acetylmuramic acid 6-phosphate etherase
MAGYDRQSLKPLINKALSELFKLPLDGGLTVSSDIDILPAALTSKPDVQNAIVLIAGTGAIAQSYAKQGNHFQRRARAGGWGRLLGDDGSGYAIGRSAIRKTLRMCDLHRMRKSGGADGVSLTPLTQAVLDHFQSQDPNCNPATLLDTLVLPNVATHGEQNSDLAVTKSIASAAEVVFSMAKQDAEAAKIVDDAAASVADLVAMLVEGQGIDLSKSALVLGGGLMASPMYRAEVLSRIEKKCGKVAHVESVEAPATVGAQSLLDRA